MPKTAKSIVVGRSRAATLSPSSPIACCSKQDDSPVVTHCVSPPEISRKLRGRPPSRPTTMESDIEKNIYARLDQILTKNNKIMEKLSSLGISIDLNSDDENNSQYSESTKEGSVSPTSAYSGKTLHKIRKESKRHIRTSNQRQQNNKRSKSDKTRRSPAGKKRKRWENDRTKSHHRWTEKVSSSEEEEYENQDQNQEGFDDFLFAATESYKSRKGKKLLFPWEYVKTDDSKTGSPGNSTWSQYISALFIMTRHRDVPKSWPKYIFNHIEQLINMAQDWSWPTCLRWSEKIFRMLEDGRLINGWLDGYAIKDIQRDICMLGTKANQAPSESKNNFEYKPKIPYDRLNDGTPCKTWNSGKDCGFQFSHGNAPTRECHLCSWCIAKFNRANAHREQDCINKRKWDRPSTIETPINKDF